MSELKAKKVQSANVDGFNETIKFKVLMCGNVIGNNNKFYCLEIQKNKNNVYRIFSHYGRLGKTNTYDIRDDDNGKSLTDLNIVEKEFNRIIAKKLKGKKVKDDDGIERLEKYEEIETIKPNVGSPNICNKETIVDVKINNSEVIKQSFKNTNSVISRIINQIVEENVHNIVSQTTFKLTKNGFETPLGPVTQSHIEKAKLPLNELKSIFEKYGKLDKKIKNIAELNTQYFSLIPHDFGHKISDNDWILDSNKLLNEYDLLEQLSSAVTMGSALSDDANSKINAIGCDIQLLEDKKDFERIKRYVETSKAMNHKSMDIWYYNIKNIIKIEIPNVRKRFKEFGTKFGNIKELFHGSKNCNILSILKNGLIVPPYNSPGVTGRMFSDGLYFANNSTKSLNYSTNFWNKKLSNKHSNVFLFIADVAMGKTYETYNQCKRPKGYDSIHAIKGKSLINDEFIVYNLEQHDLKYLIELSL